VSKQAGLSGTWTPDLLEREDELARLEGLLDGARQGSGTAVLIEAPAGLGKTRLLERMRRRADRLDVRVLTARATELERELSYGVARQLLEPAIVGAPDGGDSLLAGAAAAARPALGLGSAVSGDRPMLDDLSFSTFYGLYWLTANVSEAGPLLLAVDDAHWADAASLRFLAFLATRVEELPVLLLVAARPAPPEAEALTALSLDKGIDRIDPQPLGERSIAALLASALEAPPEPAFTAACGELTGGNPFLLTELIRTLRAEAVEPTAAGERALRDRLPDSVARSVLGRLATLSPPAIALARAVAVLGDGCETSLAAALADLEVDDATDAADAIRHAAILDSASELRFAHPLVRDAVYAELPAGARDREHRRAAALLEERGMPDERVAAQLLATEPAGDAHVVATLSAAARTSLEGGMPDMAVTCLLRALHEPPPADRRNELMRLLLAAGVRGADKRRLTSLVTPLMTDERRAELIADPETFRESADHLAMGLMGLGRDAEARELLARAIDDAEDRGDLTQAVSRDALLIFLAQMPAHMAREHFERRWAGRLQDDTPEHRLWLALQARWGSLLGDRATEVAKLARRALEGGQVFRENLDLPTPIQCVNVLTNCDELDAAAAGANALIEAATLGGSMGSLTGGWAARGTVAYRRGDLASAEADIRQAYDLARLRDFLAVVPRVAGLMVRVLAERDELEAADEVLATSGLAGPIPPSNWFESALFSRGLLRLAQGRAREAADDMLGLCERIAGEGATSKIDSPADVYAARALAALGEHDQARLLAEQGLAGARQWGVPSVVAEAMSALGSVTPDNAGIELLEEAVALAAPSPARLVHTKALTDLGIALRRARRPADARAPLREALAIARRCGATALARQAAAELDATGERVPRHTPIGADALTPTERRVAEMAARGMTNREIAAARYVTIKTVESHLRAAYDKLGIRSRGELAAVLGAASA
jgi:DNA-binding CsgD family transcriptional regulator